MQSPLCIQPNNNVDIVLSLCYIVGRWSPHQHLTHYPSVSVSHRTTFPVSRCPSVPVSHRPGVPVFWCPSVPVSRCPCVLVFQCPGVTMSQSLRGAEKLKRGGGKHTIFGTHTHTWTHRQRFIYRGGAHCPPKNKLIEPELTGQQGLAYPS